MQHLRQQYLNRASFREAKHAEAEATPSEECSASLSAEPVEGLQGRFVPLGGSLAIPVKRPLPVRGQPHAVQVHLAQGVLRGGVSSSAAATIHEAAFTRSIGTPRPYLHIEASAVWATTSPCSDAICSQPAAFV